MIAAVLTLSGCSGGSDQAKDGKGEDTFKAILITDIGGLGDKGFNDSGWIGCQNAKKRLAERGIDIEIQFIESSEQTDYIDNLNLASERADVVIGLGFLIADSLSQIAKHYPHRSYIFIDGALEEDNIASFVFRAEEGGFLAGVLASYVSKSGVVGILPGMDIPPVESFAAGFKVGAETGGALQGKSIRVLSTTVGSFSDPVKAKSISQSLMSQGADIIFQLAGNSGLGAIEAVKDAPGPVYVIGVDIDQDDLLPGKILTSVLKRMDKAVSDQIVAVYDKQFKGGVFKVGLKEGYVGLTEMKHTRHLVPEEAFKAIEHARELIVSEEMKIPRTKSELPNFNPPLKALKQP